MVWFNILRDINLFIEKYLGVISSMLYFVNVMNSIYKICLYFIVKFLEKIESKKIEYSC